MWLLALQSFHRFVIITKKLQLEGLYHDHDNSAGKKQQVDR